MTGTKQTGLRPAEHLIYGSGASAVVVVPARVAAYLNRHAGLSLLRRDSSGDPEVDNLLLAFRLAELEWQSSATGTTHAEPPELDRSLQWMSTEQVAGLLGMTGRGIRKAISEGRLKALKVGDHYRISATDFEHFRASRTTR